MTIENWWVVMLRKDFCFHSLFYHYHQQALWQDMKSFVQYDSAINLESFVAEWFWQRVKFISLQWQQAWRTVLYKYNLRTFKID